MKKIVFIFILLIFTQVIAQEIGFVSAIKENVFIVRNNKKHLCDRFFIIQNNDIIKTQNNSIVSVKFIDKDLIKLKSNTNIELKTKLKEDKIIKDIYINSGCIYYNCLNDIRIFVNDNFIYSQNGEFYIEKNKDNVKIYCINGNVFVSNSNGKIKINKNESAEIMENSSPYKILSEKFPIWKDYEIIENDILYIEFVDGDGNIKILKIYTE